MKDKDALILENLYELIVEDAQSSINQALNLILRAKLGNEVFKYKNKPENQMKVRDEKHNSMNIIQKFIEVIKARNPNDKNLSDVIPLTNFYLKTPNYLNQIVRYYETYMQYPSLVQQRVIAKVDNYTDWAAAIHAEESKKSKETYTSTLGGSNDPNKVYEDEEVIVFRATDPEDIDKSIDNCKKYGKGSRLCISSGNDSNILHHYLDYRLNHKLTTYFVWLKDKETYILIDAQDDGRYSYNTIEYNSDYPNTTRGELVNEYPELKGAFEANAFESLEIGQGEYKHKVDEFEKELQDIEDSYKDKLKNCSVHFDVNHDGGDYVYYYGSGSIKIEGVDLVEKIDISDPYDFSRIKNYSGSGRSDSIPYQYKENPEEFYKLVKLLNDFSVYYGNITDYMTGIYEGQDGTVYLNFDVAGDDGGSSTNTNDFDYMCSMMVGYEKDYNSIKKAFIRALRKNGFLNQDDSKKEIDNQEEFIAGLENFEYDEEDPEIFELTKKLLTLTVEENTKLTNSNGMFTGTGDVETNSKWIAARIYWLIYHNYKQQEPDGEQLNFKKFMESYYSYEDADLYEYGINGVKLEFKRYEKDNSFIISGSLEIKIEYLTEEASKVLKFLNDSAEDIENIMYYLATKLCNKPDKKSEDIRKLYRKYI
jgi:hypothetical protein